MSSSKPPASIIVAAIVAVLGSLLTMLSMALGLIGFYLAPAGKDLSGAPPFAIAVASGAFVFMLVFSAFGVLTGLGLLQLKNWARISALVWSGLAVFFCSLAMLFVLVLPFPPMPGAAQNVNIAGVKAVLGIIYGLPILIGVWWIILFNEKGTKALFARKLLQTERETPVTPHCPLPVALIAALMLFSVAGMFLMPLMHMPVTIIFFGQRLRGELGAFLFAATTVLYLASAIGLLGLKRWSYPLTIGLQVFWMVSGVVTFLRPNYARNVQEIFSEMHMPEAASGNISELMHNRFFALASLIPGVIMLGILLYYRRRFLQSANAAETLHGVHRQE